MSEEKLARMLAERAMTPMAVLAMIPMRESMVAVYGSWTDWLCTIANHHGISPIWWLILMGEARAGRDHLAIAEEHKEPLVAALTAATSAPARTWYGLIESYLLLTRWKIDHAEDAHAGNHG
jgi:hypothetical protein